MRTVIEHPSAWRRIRQVILLAVPIPGVLALFLGIALYRGQHRSVWLVNGWKKPYTVRVNGVEHQLAPVSGKRIELPEGQVTVDWPEGGDGPQTVTIQTSFFGRPVHRPVYILNPDRCALLEGEETVYSHQVNAPMSPPIVYFTGKLLHQFDGVDYEFQPFPATIRIKGNERTNRTRLGLAPMVDTNERFMKITQFVPAEEQRAYAKRLVQLDPDDELALDWLIGEMSPKEAIAFLKPRLADRPVRVAWHRNYQAMAELASPAVDLQPEYRLLVQQTKRAADAVYLLGRVESAPMAEKLFTEAATAKRPSASACSGLGFRSLVRGDFPSAVKWTKKAAELNPSNVFHRSAYLNALLAAGQLKELLAELAKDPPQSPLLSLHDHLTAYLALGDKAGAEAVMTGIIQRYANQSGLPLTPAALAQLSASVELQMALAERDRSKYLGLVGRAAKPDEFARSLLTGDSQAAAKVPIVPVRGAMEWEIHATRAGLLYLAGHKAQDVAFAEMQWLKLAEALARGDHDAQRLAEIARGQESFDFQWLRDATIRPAVKRVILAAISRRLPAQAKNLEPLMRKLDFERDATSLCLKYVME